MQREIKNYQMKLNGIFQNIYELFKLAFRIVENSSASEIFYSRLFQKLKSKGLIPELVSQIYSKMVSGTKLMNYIYLIHRSLYPFSSGNHFSIKFQDVFYETIEGLDKNIKKLILYR